MEYEADPDADNLPGSELVGPALFTALLEEAGLKLESAKGTVGKSWLSTTRKNLPRS